MELVADVRDRETVDDVGVGRGVWIDVDGGEVIWLAIPSPCFNPTHHY